MKISIITVSYNAAETIERTIRSVIEQDYEDKEYIIIDGGSTDGTKEIIEKYEDYLAFYVSEPDHGMYDALVKGFKHATGEICAYINADDFYQPHAFCTVAEIFEKYNGIKWLTGINAVYNSRDQITSVDTPYKYNCEFIQKGLYDGIILPFIQQESTFWRKDLMQYLDFNYLEKLRLAGDYYLWQCFSKHSNLEVVSCILSGFRRHAGQLSENITEYRKEKEQFCNKQTYLDVLRAYMYKLRFYLPKRFMNHMIKYDFQNECW